MSIYATNYVVDELTGDKKLIKHLNKSGNKARLKGGNENFYSSKSQRKVRLKLNELKKEQGE
jgi:hypothetical protein